MATKFKTKEEWDKFSAEKFNCTVEEMHARDKARGRVTEKCDCDYEHCHGWKSVRLNGFR